ncbi:MULTISPECIES: hypothetical protein [Brevibacillus]|uniref:hypothetical protein n=1 Tax=Brevibacillus TaxID=55080 RepID=UPI000E2E90A1|nr:MULTISPECIES: hypothetical protein [Brevibacillus]MBG9786340.1 hypothetical protein [Brevibacillus laterosporus]MED1787729.1 hypothetical protein [Brevibacillus laterosporus]RFB34103.1 hypothetical protein DZB91_12695 [Brevibacillus sp. VP]
MEKRFYVIREIILQYEARLKRMEMMVVQFFTTNQLEAISECVDERERIEKLIKKLQQFVEKWEAYTDMSIDY